MSNLSSALQQLRQEHKQAEQQSRKATVGDFRNRRTEWDETVREPRATVLDPAVSHRWPHAGEWHWRKNCRWAKARQGSKPSAGKTNTCVTCEAHVVSGCPPQSCGGSTGEMGEV